MKRTQTLIAAFLLFIGCFAVANVAGNGWSQDLAFQYLYYSYAAYCPQDQLADWSCKWCQEPQVAGFQPTAFPYDKKIDGFGYVGVHEANETIVVAFRGTESSSLRNWIIDLENLKLKPYRNYTDIYVGEGWQNEWDDLSPQVLPAVQHLVETYPTFDIWVTGHSLGAAISIMCAAELAEEGYGPIYVYNYGLPRVGDDNFANLYKSLVPHTYRVVNGNDIVPHLPFESMGFHHVPTEVWENPAEGLSFTVCDGSGEDPNCSDSNFLDLSVFDHLHYLNVFEDCSTSSDKSHIEAMEKDPRMQRLAVRVRADMVDQL